MQMRFVLGGAAVVFEVVVVASWWLLWLSAPIESHPLECVRLIRCKRTNGRTHGQTTTRSRCAATASVVID